MGHRLNRVPQPVLSTRLKTMLGFIYFRSSRCWRSGRSEKKRSSFRWTTLPEDAPRTGAHLAQNGRGKLSIRPSSTFDLDQWKSGSDWEAGYADLAKCRSTASFKRKGVTTRASGPCVRAAHCASMSAPGHFRPIQRSCLLGDVRFDPKAPVPRIRLWLSVNEPTP